jgi:prepilin peptidase CpaA
MKIEQIPTIIIICIYMACLCHAMWTDITKMKISNSVSLILLAAFVPFAVFYIEPFTALLHIAIAAAVFAVTFGLYAIRAMGGGDVKLISASAVWLGPQHILPFLMMVALLGGLIAVLMIALRRTMPQHDTPSASRAMRISAKWISSGRLPYGVPISVAALSHTQAIFGPFLPFLN